jgi:hypothetical protein
MLFPLLLALAGAGQAIARPPDASPPIPRRGYVIESVTRKGGREYRCRNAGHHFLSVIEEDGAVIIRPHPGNDINGWGSSWYPEPFFPGATIAHATVVPPEADERGIHLRASGGVSRDRNQTYGTWRLHIDFQFDRPAKRIAGSGAYSIVLAGPLSARTGDLNLYKIASNYLEDVPLLSGGSGDTGDMRAVEVTRDGRVTTWYPAQRPAHFPSDRGRKLSVMVLGQFNTVATARQGFAPIAPAVKPSLRVELEARQPYGAMSFGGFFSRDRAKDFAADNIGITPLIRAGTRHTAFDFDLRLESSALPMDP